MICIFKQTWVTWISEFGVLMRYYWEDDCCSCRWIFQHFETNTLYTGSYIVLRVSWMHDYHTKILLLFWYKFFFCFYQGYHHSIRLIYSNRYYERKLLNFINTHQIYSIGIISQFGWMMKFIFTFFIFKDFKFESVYGTFYNNKNWIS